MSISNYNDFIFESLINESILYLAPEMRKKLKRTRSDIAKDVLSIEGTNISDDITFLNIDKDGYISYNTMKNAVNFLQDTFPHVIDTIRDQGDTSLSDIIYAHDNENGQKITGIFTKSRGKIKFGRLINKLFPSKYKPNQIEEFTNKWKSITDESVGEKFEIVEGNDISYWYNQDNYKELRGSLGNSCMRSNSENIFRIYTMNPEVCRMLVLYDNDGLMGRAIIWKVSYKSKGNWEYFMDRQYTTSDALVEKFRNYAIEQGWSYKTNNSHSSYEQVSWREGDSIITSGVKMNVKLKPYKSGYDYDKYPYVDTFRRYDPNSGILYNDDKEDVMGNYLLNDTSGGYTECESGVWSEWHSERIPTDEAVWSDNADSYLWRDRAVEVTRGMRRHRGYYPDNYDSITYDEYHDDYIHEDDAVYSDIYNHSILSDDAVSAIYEIDSDGEPNSDEAYVYSDDSNYIGIDDVSDMYWYEQVSDKFRDWEDGRKHYVIDKHLLTKNYKNEWIPKVFKIEVYQAVDSSIKLSTIDAKIIGREINIDNPIVTDKYQYNKDIEILYPELYKAAKEKLVELESNKNIDESKMVASRLVEIEYKEWLEWELPEKEESES